MRLSKSVHLAVLALASFGLAFPNAAAWADQVGRSTSVQDVALGSDGYFEGQLLSTKGQPQRGVEVALHARGRVVARTTTSQDGRFAFRGLRGGVYSVASSKASARVVRAWAPRTAPPSAKHGLLLIHQGEVARGQLLDLPGFETIGMGGLLVLGGIFAIVGTTVMDRS